MAEELTDPYCTLEDVQQECRNERPTVTDKFIRSINLASRMVEDYCRRDFLYHDHTGHGNPLRVQRGCVMEETIYLPYHVIELTGLRTYDRRADADSATLWPVDDYYTESDIKKNTCRIFAERGLKFGDYPFMGFLDLFGRFGYDVPEGHTVSPDLPASIRKATAVIAATLSMERRLEQTNLEGNRIELVELNIPREVFHHLNRFRNFSYML